MVYNGLAAAADGLMAGLNDSTVPVVRASAFRISTRVPNRYPFRACDFHVRSVRYPLSMGARVGGDNSEEKTAREKTLSRNWKGPQ